MGSSGINADMDRFELRTELKKHFASMRDELQNATVFKGAKGLVAIVTAKTFEGRIEIQREIKDVCKNRMGKTRKSKQEIGGYAVRYDDKDGIVYLERAQNQYTHKVVPSKVVTKDPDYERARETMQARQHSPARSNSQQMRDRQADRISKATQNESRVQTSYKRSAGKSPQGETRETARPRMECNTEDEEMGGN